MKVNRFPILNIVRTFSRSLLTGDSNFLRDAATAFAVKLFSALFSYLMFVSLAKITTGSGFGVFSFAFSLALLLAKIGAVGQSELMVRVLPRIETPEQFVERIGVVTFGVMLVFCVSIGLALALVIVSHLFVTEENLRIALFASAFFVPVMAISELQSGILRAVGSVILALAPREVVWRGTVTIVALWLYLNYSLILPPGVVLIACGVCLCVFIAIQASLHPTTRLWLRFRDRKIFNTKEWGAMMVPLWISSIVTFAAPSFAVVLIGFTMQPEATGSFFAALKTAQLINLFLVASNIVAAPLISRYYGNNDIGQVQRITTACAVFSFGFGFAGFLAFLATGESILAQFDPSYTAAKLEMLVLGGAYVVSAAAGPAGVVLQMTAHEGLYMRMMLWINSIGLIILLPATLIFGAVGAAFTTGGIIIVWNIWAVWICRNRLNIDPSVFSLLKQNMSENK